MPARASTAARRSVSTGLREAATGSGFGATPPPSRPRASAGGGAPLAGLARSGDGLWLRGNHDPEPPSGFGGRALAEWRAGPLVFHHEPHPGPAPGEVAGHLHPRATVTTGRRQVSGRVFATDGRRLLLPAFGAYTGGLDVHDPAVRMLFARPPRVFLPGRDSIHAFPWSRLAVPDRLRNGGG